MKKNIFLYNDYRNFLNDWIKNDSSLIIQELAQQISIQRTYLGQVLNGKKDLSSDQFFCLLNLFNIDEKYKEFFYLLHQFNRCGHFKRQEYLKKKLESYKKSKLRLDEYLKGNIEDQGSLEKIEYFLNPYNIVTHVFLTIPKYLKNPQLIKEELRMSNREFEKVLIGLEELKIITRENQKIKLLTDTIFLPKDAFYVNAFHERLRSLGASKKELIANEEKSAVSLVFSCSEETYVNIRAYILDSLQNAEKQLLEEDEQNTNTIAQLSLDLFKWN